jgi:hypothetical protein
MPDGLLTERTKKSFDFAADATKQLLTLSTAILALTTTLVEKVFTPSQSSVWVFLLLAWLLLLTSVLCGIWTLLQLTTSLANKVEPTIIDPSITMAALAQILLFVVALAVLIGFGMYMLTQRA